VHTIFCCSSRSPHQEAVFSWRLVIPGAMWHFQSSIASLPWTDTFPKSFGGWTWASWNIHLQGAFRRVHDLYTTWGVVFCTYPRKSQADQTACPVVVVGNPESMDHPKNQPLCLVGWTSRAYKISLPTFTQFWNPRPCVSVCRYLDPRLAGLENASRANFSRDKDSCTCSTIHEDPFHFYFLISDNFESSDTFDTFWHMWCQPLGIYSTLGYWF